MSIDIPPPVSLSPKTHRFFDDLVTALASTAALMAGYSTHAGHHGYRFLDDWPLRMACLTRREGRSTLEVEVRPASLLTPLTNTSWPTSFVLTFDVVTDVSTPPVKLDPTPTSPLTGFRRLSANIIEHAFLAYYERYLGQINEARSKAGPGGLPVLAFGRAIRNAFGHGGTIHFSKSGETVSWGGLTYSDSLNGRQVMYNDLSQGDLILLMLEMDQLF